MQKLPNCRHSRNVFNCGEGTFRLFNSTRQRLRFLSDVFCTSNRWERIGGVPSLSRAVFDQTGQFPTFHGPHQIESLLTKFADLTDIDPELAIREDQFNRTPFFEDSYKKIDFLNLHRNKDPNAEEPTVMAYVCRLRPRKRTLILSKLRTILNGIDATLDNGTAVYAKDFLRDGFPGANFLSENFLTSYYFRLFKIFFNLLTIARNICFV